MVLLLQTTPQTPNVPDASHEFMKAQEDEYLHVIDEGSHPHCGLPCAAGAEEGLGRGASGELRSINIHRQGSGDPSPETTPPSRHTPSALLLPGGGRSSRDSSPMHAVAAGVPLCSPQNLTCALRACETSTTDQVLRNTSTLCSQCSQS